MDCIKISSYILMQEYILEYHNTLFSFETEYFTWERKIFELYSFFMNSTDLSELRLNRNPYILKFAELWKESNDVFRQNLSFLPIYLLILEENGIFSEGGISHELGRKFNHFIYLPWKGNRVKLIVLSLFLFIINA